MGFFYLKLSSGIRHRPLNQRTSAHTLCSSYVSAGFSISSVGVLTADAITGPYSFASACFKPDGADSYDMVRVEINRSFEMNAYDMVRQIIKADPSQLLR